MSTLEEQQAPWTIAELHWAVKLIAYALRAADADPANRDVLFDSIEGFLEQLIERLPPPPPLAARRPPFGRLPNGSAGMTLGIDTKMRR